ncbi:sulfur globule protein CV3 [Thiolapillus sp.]
MKSLKRILLAAVVAGGTLMAGSASAFFGGWAPWNWFDDDDWYDYPPPWYYGAPYGYGYAPYGYGYAPYGYGYAPYGYGYPYGGYPYSTQPPTPQSSQPAKPAQPSSNNPGR